MTNRLRFKHWSITYRLSFYFAVGSLALISIMGAYLYTVLDRSLTNEHTVFMADDIDRLRSTLKKISDVSELNNNSEWPRPLALARRRLDVAIYDANFGMLFGTPLFSIPTPAWPAPAQIGERAEQSRIWRSPQGEYYRLLTAWANVGSDPNNKVLLTLALDISVEQKILNTYHDTLLATLLIAILCASALGYFITRRGLAPIKRIAQAASEITSSQLDKKLELEDAPEELRELAAAFNDMLQRLHESFSRLSQFSTDLAHEFRTPINNLLGEAQVALTKARSADEYRMVLESNVEEYERLSRMVENMLFLARADYSKARIATQWLDARTELENISEFYQLIADESAVRIACVGDAKIYADPILFRRAINNLLSNALHHSGQNSKVEVRTASAKGGAATVCIKNSGPDIPPEHLSKIFDRFYRIEPSRDRSIEGVGLGLAIVRTIMHLHGGTVSVVSADGITAFTLWFPAMSS